MDSFTFKKASPSMLSEIETIYARARSYMRETGNPTQWGSVYPSRELILSDIEKGELHVIIRDGIEAVFVFTEGADPCYDEIDGSWLSTVPYRAVHRVASAGKSRGILSAIMDYCFKECHSIRIDTHEDNTVMQHQLEKYGFVRCGIIHLENGEARIGYQMTK